MLVASLERCRDTLLRFKRVRLVDYEARGHGVGTSSNCKRSGSGHCATPLRRLRPYTINRFGASALLGGGVRERVEETAGASKTSMHRSRTPA